MHSPILESAYIWHDLHDSELPILRFYSWEKPTISLGYFQSLEVTKGHFPDEELEFIRRWTGGGSVDHRMDLTYTLIIPHKHPWADLRGALSYQMIHHAVASALNCTGSPCSLTKANPALPNTTTPCFTQPVEHDIINASGKKLAGAGQKRSRQGLLHQGSVIDVAHPSLWKDEFIKQLTRSSITWTPEINFDTQKDFDQITQDLANARYASAEWLTKRP